jgi:hypothetical protein
LIVLVCILGALLVLGFRGSGSGFMGARARLARGCCSVVLFWLRLLGIDSREVSGMSLATIADGPVPRGGQRREASSGGGVGWATSRRASDCCELDHYG